MTTPFNTDPAPTLRLSTDNRCPSCGWKGHFAGQRITRNGQGRPLEKRTCISCATRYVVRTTEPLARC